MDKLFKDKLGDHTISPAPQSWEKIESRLTKKNRISAVLRVAATAVLAGALVILILRQDDRTPEPAITNEGSRPTPSVIPVPAQPNVAETTAPPAPEKAAPRQHAKKLQAQEATPAQPEVVLDAEIPEPVMTAAVEQPQPSKTKRIVIVYSLPTVGKKAEAPIVGPVEEEKRTGLQKVMDVALEVKSGDNPLGELREAKDELFALEFRKDKNKSKNH